VTRQGLSGEAPTWQAEAGPPPADLLPVTYLEEDWLGAVDLRASDHNLPLAIDIEGPFDHGLLLDALRALAGRQETLRMAFTPTGAGIQRSVWPSVEPSMYTADLSDVPAGERDHRLTSMILAEARRPTDLTSPPLWRGFTARMAPGHHVLVTIWHHAIFDGWSTRVAFRDLTAAYASLLRGQTPRLAEPDVQMADYAGWERQLTLPGDAVAYWRSALPGGRASLPMDPAAEHAPQVMVGRPYPTVSAAQLARLTEIAGGVGATLTSALRAVVLTALRPYLPDQAVIGCVHGNRDRPELQRVIGLLSDHLPVRVDLSGRQSFLDLTAGVHDAVRTARRYQAPSGLIAAAVPAIPPGEQMFEVSVNNMRQAAPLATQVTASDGATVRFAVRDVPGNQLWPHISRPFSGGVRLGYQLRQTLAGQLSGEIWGHVPAFEVATVDALGQALARTVELVAGDPRQDVRSYPGPAGGRHP
jgi:Condensation domain